MCQLPDWLSSWGQGVFEFQRFASISVDALAALDTVIP